MELSAFISETIKSLFKGITDTQQFARDNGGRVNPMRMQSRQDISAEESVYFGNEEYARPLTLIEFDIAVTTTSQQEAGIEGGIKVFSINLGGKNMATDANQTASHLRFKLGVVLPHELT